MQVPAGAWEPGNNDRKRPGRMVRSFGVPRLGRAQGAQAGWDLRARARTGTSGRVASGWGSCGTALSDGAPV